MKQFLEDMSVAVTLAEAGLWEDARDIAPALRSLGKSGREKVLLVSGGESIPKDILGFAMDFSRRMRSDLVVLMPEPKGRKATALRKEFSEMAEKADQDSKVVFLTTKENLPRTAKEIMGLAKRFQVALLHGIEDKTPYRDLRIPLYSASV